MGRIAATELMPDFTGRTLGHGRFRLLESLGAGAYGKVYRAEDAGSSNSRPKIYAIKCLNKPQPGSHTDILQQREFALHKLVSGHKNIVTFHKYFSDDRFVYVVLDLCTGGDLFAAITEKHLFHNNGRLIKTAFIQLIDAVQHCHDLGVFHRDIKPENVLCSKDGTNIRLADFGLSIQSPVCHDFGCGSSYYMSPECIGREMTTGNYSTRHNDVWALGVILTNMITGRNPWRYATPEDECFSAYLHNNDFLQQVLPISAGVNSILKRIFTINPLCRISLPALRKEILELNTFFMDDRDRTAGKATKTNDNKAHQSSNDVGNKKKAATSSRTLVSSDDSTRTVDSDERYVFASPVVDYPLQPPIRQQPQFLFPGDIEAIQPTNFVIGDSESAISLSVPSTAPSSGQSSGQSSIPSASSGSSAPITPGTYAVEPAINIPEFSGLGIVDITDTLFIDKSKVPVSVKTKKSTRHLFRNALQRIKGQPAVNSS